MNQRLDALIKTRHEDLPPTLSPRKQWHNQKGAARTRGIAFRLTFDEWEQWWRDSGHYHERGKRRDSYVMARIGDAGAYELGNLECITARRNCIDGNARRGRVA
jgi:hypothetical protein